MTLIFRIFAKIFIFLLLIALNFIYVDICYIFSSKTLYNYLEIFFQKFYFSNSICSTYYYELYLFEITRYFWTLGFFLIKNKNKIIHGQYYYHCKIINKSYCLYLFYILFLHFTKYPLYDIKYSQYDMVIHHRYWYCWSRYIYINKYHICVISKIFSGKFQIKIHFHLCYRKKLFKYIRILRSLKSMKRELIVHLKILLYFVLFTKKMKRNLKSWFQLISSE